VEGKVLFPDGTPLTEGMVTFEAVDQPKVMARGQIRSDGSFRLSTYKPNDGAVPGRHRVLVMTLPPVGRQANLPPLIHPSFTSFETSGLEYTVLPGKNSFQIEVRRP
jgi:hypothetical protein